MACFFFFLFIFGGQVRVLVISELQIYKTSICFLPVRCRFRGNVTAVAILHYLVLISQPKCRVVNVNPKVCCPRMVTCVVREDSTAGFSLVLH